MLKNLYVFLFVFLLVGSCVLGVFLLHVIVDLQDDIVSFLRRKLKGN